MRRAVQEWDIDLFWDLAENLFAQSGRPTADVKARNVNTIDEVPDSSWFTNRILAPSRCRSAEAVRGPLTGTARRQARGRWQAQGGRIRAGLHDEDAKGETWFVSFDGKGFPEAATGAILVANKIFWALGYWQIENYLVHIQPKELVIADTAKIRRRRASDAR